jgi:protein ImuB
MTRALVAWLPDWPITAFLRTVSHDQGEAHPLATVHANRVVACSAAARAEGVRRGQRRRDAQASCAALRIVAADPGRDERAFLPVLTALDALAPGVQMLRAGLAAPPASTATSGARRAPCSRSSPPSVCPMRASASPTASSPPIAPPG